MNTHMSRPDLISPFCLNRVGLVLAAGIATHPDSQYHKGGAPGFSTSRYYEKAMRHMMQYALGKKDEDHLACAICNLNFIIDIQGKAVEGVVPPELDDMPCYKTECEDGKTEEKQDDRA